jgi:hypothetical protein
MLLFHSVSLHVKTNAVRLSSLAAWQMTCFAANIMLMLIACRNTKLKKKPLNLDTPILVQGLKWMVVKPPCVAASECFVKGLQRSVEQGPMQLLEHQPCDTNRNCLAKRSIWSTASYIPIMLHHWNAEYDLQLSPVQGCHQLQVAWMYLSLSKQVNSKIYY